ASTSSMIVREFLGAQDRPKEIFDRRPPGRATRRRLESRLQFAELARVRPPGKCREVDLVDHLTAGDRAPDESIHSTAVVGKLIGIGFARELVERLTQAGLGAALRQGCTTRAAMELEEPAGIHVGLVQFDRARAWWRHAPVRELEYLRCFGHARDCIEKD